MNDLDQILTAISSDHLGISTLKERKSDSLDFHTVAVWSIGSALKAAYVAGRIGPHNPIAHKRG